jgi:hypothetical protein
MPIAGTVAILTTVISIVQRVIPQAGQLMF